MKDDSADLIGGDNSRSTELYKVLLKGLPQFRNERHDDLLNCQKLAGSLGISDKAIYRWFGRQSVPPKKVNPLIALPGSLLTQAVLLPFVLD